MADFDYKGFVGRPKCMLIAPAGYGKTHSIVESLKHTIGKQLILTHTHAGIAAVREKLKAENVSTSKYHIETINSYAQKYVLAFRPGELPDQKNTRTYFPAVIEKATAILLLPAIADVIRSSYAGLFVDEYQDCTASQHKLIQILSGILPTRILGDHLQGIFDFGKDSMVDLRDHVDMGGFLEKPFTLAIPWRWKKANNEQLGACLQEIRLKLENSATIDLSQHPEIETVVVPENDFFNPQNSSYKKITQHSKSSSLLIIHPESHNLKGRIKLIRSFPFLGLLEAIDQDDFYRIAETLDLASKETMVSVIIDCCSTMFNTTGIGEWLNKTGVKRKKTQEQRNIIQPVQELFTSLRNEKQLLQIVLCFQKISALPKIKCYRKELFTTVCRAVEEAYYENTTIIESMGNKRNQLRRIGRKVFGRCVGTTLLTKGLEFETVIVLNAHKFACPKHLYVSLTRASKKLIVFTENCVLNPH